ncbi:MAG TPA: hypothetical protein VD866_26820 [Urbifossiella sp.]|nr:hypothetical protein [Urbifossiella sp.]
MAQHDQNIANADGATVRADLNNALAAIFTNSAGTSAPGTTVAHQFWADTASNLLKKRNAANSGWVVLRTLDETFLLSRSSDTVLGVSDVGKSIAASSTFTQTLAAAATLGDGWFVDYVNTGSGVVTLDANGAETIDGLTTLPLHPREGCRIYCNGTAFVTSGLSNGVALGSFTRNLATASGSQAVTGVGFKPRAVVFLACVDGSVKASWGLDTLAAVYSVASNASNVAGNFVHSAAGSITVITGTGGSDYGQAVVSSFDADGFTLAWTKGGAATGTAEVGYLALR